MEIYTFDMSFGTDLKAWRKKAGLTQEELSDASGVSVPYISNLERDISHNTRSGKPKASEAVCEKFARVLGVDPEVVKASAGHATPIDDPMIRAIVDIARKSTYNEGFSEDERAEFQEDVESTIARTVQRILARRKRDLTSE